MANVTINNITNVVQDPALHDSALVGVLSHGSVVRFQFATVDSRFITILLTNVRGLLIDSFFETNIVFEVRIQPSADAHPDDLQRALHLSGVPESDALRLRSIKEDGCVLMHVDSTLGASVIAICKNVTWDYST